MSYSLSPPFSSAIPSLHMARRLNDSCSVSYAIIFASIMGRAALVQCAPCSKSPAVCQRPLGGVGRALLTDVDGTGFESVELPYALSHGDKGDKMVGVASLGLLLLLDPRRRAPGALLLLGLLDVVV